MKRRNPFVKPWLIPLSYLWGIGVALRNRCYEKGILKSYKFDIPIISVGNLTVGGTGKTPHVEYLIELLQNVLPTAVISRGYKRKKKGLVEATSNSTANDIGDEPLQMFAKYPDCRIVVNSSRAESILYLLKQGKVKPGIIIMDDGFQHRQVEAGLHILLTDYNRLFTEDYLLPAGRLREPIKEKDRANIVIVTKCPQELSPFEYRVLKKQLNLRPYQSLYFTSLVYGELYPLYQTREERVVYPNEDTEVLLLVGVANPHGFIQAMGKKMQVVECLTFPDHHNFTIRDVTIINKVFEKLLVKNRCIVTTEKDACRLLITPGLSKEVKKSILVQPISVYFLQEGKNSFNEQIRNYVNSNSNNSTMAKPKIT